MADEVTTADDAAQNTATDDNTQDDTNDDASTTNEPDWKAEARKHEKRAKVAAKQARELEEQLKGLQDADKSEQEKAIEQAREDARAEAQAEIDKERRSDRLEVAVAKQARDFADVDDVLLNIERGIRDGDIDESEIFDDKGKVQTKALTSALNELLERKPHLKAGPHGRPAGDADAGKGAGAGGDFNSVLREKAKR